MVMDGGGATLLQAQPRHDGRLCETFVVGSRPVFLNGIFANTFMCKQLATRQEVVALLEPDGAGRTTLTTLTTLRNLAAHPRFRDALRDAGAIPPLVTLIRAAFIELTTASGPAGILASLATMSASSAVSPLSPAPSPSPPQSPANAAFRLAHLVRAALNQEEDATYTASSEAATVPSDPAAGTLTCLARAARFKERVDSPQMAAEAAGALTSLAHSCEGEGEGELLQAAAEASAALANLAADNTANRDAIREAGAIEPLVALLRSEAAPAELLAEAARALSNLCIGSTANQELCRQAGAVAHLVSLVGGGYSAEVAQRAAAALRNLGDEAAVRAALVRLLRHQHQQRRLPPFAFRKPLQPLAAVYNGKLIAKHRRGERSAAAADGAPSADDRAD
mgnify:CR=1 FL=1